MLPCMRYVYIFMYLEFYFYQRKVQVGVGAGLGECHILSTAHLQQICHNELDLIHILHIDIL